MTVSALRAPIAGKPDVIGWPKASYPVVVVKFVREVILLSGSHVSPSLLVEAANDATAPRPLASPRVDRRLRFFAFRSGRTAEHYRARNQKILQFLRVDRPSRPQNKTRTTRRHPQVKDPD